MMTSAILRSPPGGVYGSVKTVSKMYCHGFRVSESQTAAVAIHHNARALLMAEKKQKGANAKQNDKKIMYRKVFHVLARGWSTTCQCNLGEYP